ncbi:MAG: NUDIX hydrolase [Patescibacteria group bacterium]|nr:NUDIX hydrolase [Patescibacteria group bacterium]
MYKILKSLGSWNFGNRFTVEKLLVESSNGLQGEFYMRSSSDFAIVMPLLDAETLVMVEQPRLGIEGLSLEFPMGQVAGKSDDDIATIELKEETGYTAGKLTLLQRSYPSPGWSKQRALIYVAEDLVAGSAEPEPMEMITVREVGIPELEGLIRAGRIYSLHSIAAFYLLKDYLAGKLR